jgi:hypothetical protein
MMSLSVRHIRVSPYAKGRSCVGEGGACCSMNRCGPFCSPQHTLWSPLGTQGGAGYRLWSAGESVSSLSGLRAAGAVGAASGFSAGSLSMAHCRALRVAPSRPTSEESEVESNEPWSRVTISVTSLRRFSGRQLTVTIVRTRAKCDRRRAC